ncbi:MAG: methyl-accepting chemotaxis protein [Burkholderiales bacterium]|nr:methyl-accepting chemotaxis protein [Burkholderiales bacterium]
MRMNIALFKTPITAIGAGTLLLAGCVIGLVVADSQVTRAIQNRYDSYLLANELRQSSDDLTRLARTFVATGDPKWEQQYGEVLAIRNGTQARPQHYDRIYWDFRAADETPPVGTGEAMSLTERMKRAGFSAAEFGKLDEAQRNSNDLVRTETVAMNMVKGLYDDGKGGFTRKAEPVRARALDMMNGRDYHVFKAKIMAPINDFLGLLDARTSAAVAQAQTEQHAWAVAVTLATLLIGVATALSLRQWWWINRRLGGAPDEVVSLVQRLASGDLSHGGESRQGDAGSVLARLFELRERLAGIIAAVRRNAESVATASTQIAQGNMDLSSRTEQQAGALEQTAATMGGLGTAARNSADSAAQANQLAESASGVVVEGGEVVGRVVETMRGINDSSKKIADIITVIDGIAFQTNILALNAAVEAARAGEQGRGFAVVASEVRSLAQRSAEAAREIKSLISANVERVDQGTSLVDQAGRTMSEIVVAIKRVNDIVGEIRSASAEQSTNVLEVGRTITRLDQGTQQNAALVEQSAAAAASLKKQAAELVDAVSVFRLALG